MGPAILLLLAASAPGHADVAGISVTVGARVTVIRAERVGSEPEPWGGWRHQALDRGKPIVIFE